MLTNPTYHQKGRYFIPNSNDLSARPTGQGGAKDSVQYFIDVYERELLINFLGVDLYNELVTVYPNISDVGNEKWYNLVNGTDYVKDGISYRFDGLLGSNKNSLISAYIYCKYLENDNSYYSTTGIIKQTANNVNQFDPSPKYIASWLDFLEKYQDSYYTSNNSYTALVDSYGCVVGLDYYNEDGFINRLVTLETYLKDHESDFIGYNFKRYESLNTFGV